MRAALATLPFLTACGPAWSPASAPAHACETITQAAFDEAVANGAARGEARIYESGMVDLRTGPGVVHCATFNGGMKPCRRPNDYVIAYSTVDGETLHVRVPANAEYRFKVTNRPHTCEILN